MIQLLTEKEWLVLYLRKEGLSQAAIAFQLGTGQSAVSRFETNARAKINAARHDLAVLDKVGITVPDDYPTDVRRRVLLLKQAAKRQQ